MFSQRKENSFGFKSSATILKDSKVQAALVKMPVRSGNTGNRN